MSADRNLAYVTHLIENGFDPLFVQQQVGHRWGSTTALYTGVTGDYRNSVVRRSLDQAFTPPPAPAPAAGAPAPALAGTVAAQDMERDGR